jgi:hypothetical protein
LLQLLHCERYLVSTSGKRFAHPDNEALARVVVHGGSNPLLAFNYVSPWTRRWRDEPPRHAPVYKTCYPLDGSVGLSIGLEDQPEHPVAGVKYAGTSSW